MIPFESWRKDFETDSLYTEHEQFARWLTLVYGRAIVYEKGEKIIGWQFVVPREDIPKLKMELLKINAGLSLTIEAQPKTLIALSPPILTVAEFSQAEPISDTPSNQKLNESKKFEDLKKRFEVLKSRGK